MPIGGPATARAKTLFNGPVQAGRHWRLYILQAGFDQVDCRRARDTGLVRLHRVVERVDAGVVRTWIAVIESIAVLQVVAMSKISLALCAHCARQVVWGKRLERSPRARMRQERILGFWDLAGQDDDFGQALSKAYQSNNLG